MMGVMRFRHELTYDAPLPQVIAMLADRTFREEVCTYQRVVRSSVELDGSGAGMTVTIDQVQHAHKVPGFAKKFVGDEINIVQHESWTTDSEADLELAIPGKPGRIVGGIALTSSGNTTVETVDVDITVSIPLVGNKISGLIADLMRRALTAEESVGRDYLSR